MDPDVTDAPPSRPVVAESVERRLSALEARLSLLEQEQAASRSLTSWLALNPVLAGLVVLAAVIFVVHLID